MIFQFGLIALLGALSSSVVFPITDYKYHGHFINETVVKSQYLEFNSDDDDYVGYFDLGVSFDFYFNSVNDIRLENLTFDTSVALADTPTSTPFATYNLEIIGSSYYDISDIESSII